MVHDTMAIVMAGGQGSRLKELTSYTRDPDREYSWNPPQVRDGVFEQAKPNVPFLGRYRLVDFCLSNLGNSKISRTLVLTQFAKHGLGEHLRQGWEFGGNASSDHFLYARSPSQQRGQGWFLGTANAVYQSIDRIEREAPELVAVAGADHVYLMDYGQMISQHRQSGAALTVSAIPVPIDTARGELGVFTVDDSGRIIDFKEKPDEPAPLPSNPELCFASMGNYVFTRGALVDELNRDAQLEWGEKEQVAEDPERYTRHDFGGDIIPHMVREGLPVFAYDFSQNTIEGEAKGYWRDVGRVWTYFAANMDQLDLNPELNLYHNRWPIATRRVHAPPAKKNPGGFWERVLASPGVVVTNANVDRSILGYRVQVEEGAEVLESVVNGNADIQAPNTVIGRGARVRRAIIGENVQIPPGMRIGHDPAEDAANGLNVYEGITLVPQGWEAPL